MVEPLRHRQTKGAETDMPNLPPPRHIPTLPDAVARSRCREGRLPAKFEPFDCAREVTAKGRHRTRWRQAASYPARSVSPKLPAIFESGLRFSHPAP